MKQRKPYSVRHVPVHTGEWGVWPDVSFSELFKPEDVLEANERNDDESRLISRHGLSRPKKGVACVSKARPTNIRRVGLNADEIPAIAGDRGMR